MELLYFLRSNKRFGNLRELTNDISPTTLTRRLRELENAGLLKRTAIPTFPPTVEYELSDMGEELRPMIDLLTHWSRRWGSSNREGRLLADGVESRGVR